MKITTTHLVCFRLERVPKGVLDDLHIVLEPFVAVQAQQASWQGDSKSAPLFDLEMTFYRRDMTAVDQAICSVIARHQNNSTGSLPAGQEITFVKVGAGPIGDTDVHTGETVEDFADDDSCCENGDWVCSRCGCYR